jgi:hypothetical protein
MYSVAYTFRIPPNITVVSHYRLRLFRRTLLQNVSAKLARRSAASMWVRN